MSSGAASSRAAVVARALEHERRRAVAERDAAIYAATAQPATSTALPRGRPADLWISTDAADPPRCARQDPPSTHPHPRPSPPIPRMRSPSPPSPAPSEGYRPRCRRRANGLDRESVVSCDNITTIPRAAIGRHLGYLLPAQERSAGPSDRGRLRPRSLALDRGSACTAFPNSCKDRLTTLVAARAAPMIRTAVTISAEQRSPCDGFSQFRSGVAGDVVAEDDITLACPADCSPAAPPACAAECTRSRPQWLAPPPDLPSSSR